MRTGTIVDCKNGHVFRLGLTDDGFRDCPDCGELLSNPKPSNNTFGMLTIGQAWRNKRKAERMQSKEGCHWGGSASRSRASDLSITVDVSADKMQLKLRAIAKHAAALADELDAIDNEWQCECGSFSYADFHSDSTLIERVCDECNKRYAVGNHDDLPTRLEGSD